MLMNTTFLGDSFSIKWQSRVIAQNGGVAKGILMKIGLMLLQRILYTFFICTAIYCLPGSSICIFPFMTPRSSTVIFQVSITFT